MILKTIGCVTKEEFESFSCGQPDLDKYFKDYALLNDKNGYGKTFVLYDEDVVVGFFTLCSASVRFEEFPKHLSLPKYPIPSIRIARLTVSKDHQGKGIGKELLTQAFFRILSVASTIGIKLIIVDAKESSASFYEHYGFERLKGDKLSYYLLLETLVSALSIENQ